MGKHDAARVDALRRAYEAFNRGDFDAAIAIAHPNVEYVRPGIETSLEGADAARGWMEPDAFAKQRIEALDFEVHGDKVLVRQRFSARGAESGIELEVESWAVWTLDAEGRVTRGEVYLKHEEAAARKAAGLAE